MLRLIRRFVVFLLVPLLQGCTLFQVDVIPAPKPLKEKVVEGAGRPKILLLDIAGLISEKSKEGSLAREKPSTMAQVQEALQKAEKDEAIAGVILQINSPGGTVTASDIIHHEIMGFKTRKKIPVYACITGLGTSGGYYTATAADLIFAHPTAITGSIGVLLLKFNVEGLFGKIGIMEQTIKSGEKKDILSPFRASKAEEQRILQIIIDRLADRFKEVVLARPNNRLERQELEKLADGRIYTAEQALAAKLIDRVGYLDEAIDTLKKAAGIKEARVIKYYRPGSYKGSLYSAAPLDTAPATTINLININADGVELVATPQFLYLWR
jgi:protease IV